MSCFPNNTSPCAAGKSERARLCSESNSVHRTPPRSHIVHVTRQLASLLFSLSLFLSLFFPSQVFDSPLLSTPLSLAFWSPSKLDPYNAYTLLPLFTTYETSRKCRSHRFVVPFYSDYALPRGAMSPLIVGLLSLDLAFFSSAFARLNCRTVASKVGRLPHDDSVPFFHSAGNPLFPQDAASKQKRARVFHGENSCSLTSVPRRNCIARRISKYNESPKLGN